MNAKSMAILCVEDDGDNAAIVELSLALDPALRVRFATSGEAALDLLAAGERPDLILLDVRLPGIDGLQVAREIAARYPSLVRRIAFMTAAVRPRQLAEIRATGARDVIAKPFDPLTLAARVRAAAVGCEDDCNASDLDAKRSLM